jgi:hypothetical protein
VIVVVGAGGVVGRRVCDELANAGVPGRGIGRELAGLEGASVVIDCAGPLRETASPVLSAALAAGAHYVDVGGEQAVLRELYERHDSTARRAGLVALPGAGLDCALGDLAAAWAAEHLVGAPDATEPVRAAPAPRLAEDRPLDEVCVSYVFDDLVLSAGSQRALFGAVGTRALAWRRDRWEPARSGEHRRVNAGPPLGERDAVAYAGGDAITVPRHVAANSVTSFISTTRSPAAAGALRLLARALPLVPRTAAELLAPFAPPEADFARTQFAVVAQVRRGFAAAQIVVRGHDIYRTTAVIAAWCARQLATRSGGAVGMRAPAELFHPAPALRAIAQLADLAIDPSFG